MPEGLVLTKRRSKTDQEGGGEQLGVPCGSGASTSPVRTVDRHGRGRLSPAGANRTLAPAHAQSRRRHDRVDGRTAPALLQASAR